MIKSKYFLYIFKSVEDGKYHYWYKTDGKYFKAEKPPVDILKTTDEKAPYPDIQNIIKNPWNDWQHNDIQRIVSESARRI